MSQQINLFNPIFLKQKKLFSAVTMAQALGLILVGALLLGLYARLQLGAMQEQAAATGAQLAQVKAELAKTAGAAAANDQGKVLAEEIQKKEAELASLRRVFSVLDKGDFGNTHGYAQYFRVFSRQIVEDLWLTGFTVVGAGKEISIQGRALRPETVPGFINRLTREPLMRGKSFAKLDMQRPANDAATTKAAGPTANSKPTTGFIEFTLQSSDVGGKPEQKPDQPGAGKS